MNAAKRLATGLSLCIVPCLAIAAARLWYTRPEGKTDLEHKSRLVSTPGEKTRVIKQRLAAKSRVVGRLLSGDLELAEAGAWFRYLNDNPPEHQSDYRNTFPGASDWEKACRQVILFVKVELPKVTPESVAGEAVARLEQELQSLLDQNDNLGLPW